MIRYCSSILLVCTLLIKQSVFISVYDPPGTEPATSVSDITNQSEAKEDESYVKNNRGKNAKLSEGGDDLHVDIPKLDKPLKEEDDKKILSPTENVPKTEELGVSNETKNSSVVARKGAQNSSVVPRKGVPTDKSHEETDSNIHRTTINTNKTMQPAKEEGVTSQENTLSKVIKKKPVTSDKDSVDDDDSHSYSESSSTGQDYMLTGVLIFVCIWASIFGALFFYKRAGEFWDRRHYRRMDFLVEGMYND